MSNDMLTRKRLRELLSYDPKTGVFRWRIRRGGRARAGDIAGGLDSLGYVQIRVDKRQYRAHRLTFLYMTGEWPVDEVDHINRVRHDNSWINLRQATHAQNGANHGKKPGVSGVLGVWPSGKKWKALIGKDGKKIYLGTFDTKEEAGKAYAIAARDLHGEFARVG